MTKTATVQARIDMQLKKDVEVILARLGISVTEAITIYFHAIVLHGGIPFKVKLPKKTDRSAAIPKKIK